MAVWTLDDGTEVPLAQLSADEVVAAIQKLRRMGFLATYEHSAMVAKASQFPGLSQRQERDQLGTFFPYRLLDELLAQQRANM